MCEILIKLKFREASSSREVVDAERLLRPKGVDSWRGRPLTSSAGSQDDGLLSGSSRVLKHLFMATWTSRIFLPWQRFVEAICNRADQS